MERERPWVRCASTRFSEMSEKKSVDVCYLRMEETQEIDSPEETVVSRLVACAQSLD